MVARVARDKAVRLLVLGTGGMANNHVEGFAAIPGVTLVAGVDTNVDQLTTFCDRHNIERRFSTLDEALAWGEFDALTNVTPDALHYITTLPVLAAGKHVLCEKPLASSYADAADMAQAAASAGVINMINLSYRNGSAMQQAAAMVAQGAIGQVRHFEASYLQSWLTQPAWGDWRTESQWLWRLSSQHGSKGVLGDVGIHILDFTTFVAGANALEVSARLATFDKAPGGKIGEYTLDANDSVTMQLVLDNGAVGTVSATRFASGHMNDLRLRIYGDKGGLEVLYEREQSQLNACLGDDRLSATWKEIPCEQTPTIYQRFIAAMRGEAAAVPDFARGAVLQQLLDGAEQSAQQNSQNISVRSEP